MVETDKGLRIARLGVFLKQQSPPFFLAIGLVCTALLGTVDFLTGFQVSFAPFYLLPISFVAWFAGRNAGLALSLVDALTWAVANQLAGETFMNPWILYWNAAVRLAVFVLFALLLSSMRRVLERERELARRDFVTGALNGRAFNEIAAAEIRRAKRYSRAFTIAYIDIDNFKLVNDRFGHSVGDTLLVTVARIIADSLRGSDVVARLGGDEFAIMLPEADKAAAQVAVAKIRERLLAAVNEHGWPVTFSIGVLSCKAPPDTVDELIRQADAAMYAVKRDGKNAIRYETHPA